MTLPEEIKEMIDKEAKEQAIPYWNKGQGTLVARESYTAAATKYIGEMPDFLRWANKNYTWRFQKQLWDENTGHDDFMSYTEEELLEIYFKNKGE